MSKEVRWIIEVGNETFISEPCHTAFDAVQSVRTKWGVPAFSECRVRELTESVRYSGVMQTEVSVTDD
jgi:hypothetical protein